MGYEGKMVLEYLGRTHQTSLLTDREKHLVGLAVTMTRGCQVCTRGRIEKARAAGIEDETLNALVGIVSAVNAGVAAATARKPFAWPTQPRPRNARSLFLSGPCRALSTLRHAPARVAEGGRMKGTPKVGTTGEQTFVVELRHAIDFADGGMPAVLCTPWLIWFLEHAARAAVLPLLEPGESTVGTEIQVRHLAPTPVGQTVTCRARVFFAEKSEVSFHLEAHDERNRLPVARTALRVIRVDRFVRRVEQKRTGVD